MKRAGWLLFLLIIVYFIFLIRQDIINWLELKKEKEGAALSLERDAAAVAALRERLKRLKDDDLIEELARTRLGLIKKGETAYKVILNN